MTRPAGTSGDTGLMFRGWMRGASETLMHAVSDDDPRCMIVLCGEAKQGTEEALSVAKNDRQITMAKSHLEAIADVLRIAEATPPLPVPHTHDVREMFS